MVNTVNITKRERASRFTLIELLVSKTCQICVSLFFQQKILSDFATNWSKTTPLFLKKGEGCGERENPVPTFGSFPVKRSFSPFPASRFTLIELLVDTFISSVRFFKCGDKLKPQNTPLFLKEKGGAGERGNFFSREKKFPLSPAHAHFTLIELLVVIAIIAILAAILLPALQSARERGKTTGCISNMKNVVTALNMYADNNKDLFPAAYSVYGKNSSGKDINYGWAGILSINGELPRSQRATGAATRCPAWDPNISSSYAWNYRGSYGTYGVIKGLEEFGPRGTYPNDTIYHIHRLTMLKAEYKKIPLGGDSIHCRDLYQAAYISNSRPGNAKALTGGNRSLHMRHNKKANVFYIDGHVSNLGIADINDENWMTYAKL